MQNHIEKQQSVLQSLGALRPPFEPSGKAAEDSRIDKTSLLAHLHQRSCTLFSEAEAIGSSENPRTGTESWRRKTLETIYSASLHTPADIDRGCSALRILSQSVRTPEEMYRQAYQVFERQLISQLVWRLGSDAFERLIQAIDTEIPRLDGRDAAGFTRAIQCYALETLAITASSTGDTTVFQTALESSDQDVMVYALRACTDTGNTLGVARSLRTAREINDAHRLHGLIKEVEPFLDRIHARFDEMQPQVLAALDTYNQRRLQTCIQGQLPSDVQDIFIELRGKPVAFFKAMEAAVEAGNYPLWLLQKDLPDFRGRVINNFGELQHKTLREAYAAWLDRPVEHWEDSIHLLGRKG